LDGGAARWHSSGIATNQLESNMQTRKYPRTLEEAFGPYERGNLYEPAPTHKHDRIVTWASAVALVSFIAIMIVWG
jgi:hypothetical protein